MTRESAPGRVQAYANWNGRTPTAAELAEYEAEGQRRRRQRREFRIVDEDGTATSTRDEIAADDAHCRGATVHYRDHGPHDEHPGPWRVYGTAEYADVDDPRDADRRRSDDDRQGDARPTRPRVRSDTRGHRRRRARVQATPRDRDGHGASAARSGLRDLKFGASSRRRRRPPPNAGDPIATPERLPATALRRGPVRLAHGSGWSGLEQREAEAGTRCWAEREC